MQQVTFWAEPQLERAKELNYICQKKCNIKKVLTQFRAYLQFDINFLKYQNKNNRTLRVHSP